MKEILFVSDFDEKDLTFDFLYKILPLNDLHMKKIHFLQKSPNDGLQKELSNNNIKSEINLKTKIKASHILNASKKDNIELTVINLVKKPGTSFIRKLIKKSSSPLLFINNNISHENIFSHIVFATDWSQGSAKALNFLISFKNILGEMEIVNVINKKLTIKDMRELKERIAKTRKLCLNEKIDAEAHIYAGKTTDEILLAAKDYKSTIIVVGSSTSEKSIKKYFKISSSYTVTEKSNLPVLVIP